MRVDDMYKELEGHLRRPGPKPKCSDSELIAIGLIGECFGCDVETELLNHMQAHRDKFPIIPEQSRFNRRRRNLMGGHQRDAAHDIVQNGTLLGRVLCRRWHAHPCGSIPSGTTFASACSPNHAKAKKKAPGTRLLSLRPGPPNDRNSHQSTHRTILD